MTRRGRSMPSRRVSRLAQVHKAPLPSLQSISSEQIWLSIRTDEPMYILLDHLVSICGPLSFLTHIRVFLGSLRKGTVLRGWDTRTRPHSLLRGVVPKKESVVVFSPFGVFPFNLTKRGAGITPSLSPRARVTTKSSATQ